MDSLPRRSYEDDYEVQMAITIEMNLNKKTLIRSSYYVIDVLSDIGGISGIMMSFFAIILSIWNYNHFDNYMVSKLFKMRGTSSISTI